MTIKQLKPRKCRVCPETFVPFSSLAKVCSVPCAREYNSQQAAKEFKQETKRRKVAIKTHSQWVKEVQVEFNKYIRARDMGKPCISCGRSSGAKINAGHYRPTSTHPELRFNEINCHLQCEHCNTYKSGNVGEYRFFLIGKIGLPLVEWLEGPHKPLKATIEELKFLKKYYKEQTKLIQESRA
jgi:hypothetical protein